MIRIRRRTTATRQSIGVEWCALAAGVALSLLDLFLLRGWSGSRWPLVADVAILFVASGALGLGLRLSLWLLQPIEPGRPQRSLIGAAFALPLILPVSWLLFQGTGISQRWYAAYGPLILAPLLYLGLALKLNVLGWLVRRVRGRGRLLLLPPVMAWSIFFFWADRALYPHQYNYLHWLLLLLVWGGLATTAWIIMSQRASWRATGATWFLTPTLALGLLLAACLMPVGESPGWRQVEERSYAGGRLLEVARRLADLDGDHYSVILGEQDCDNRDPAIHPFAMEIPGNGMDEDCDGQDRIPPPPAPTKAARERIDVSTYKDLLGQWRRSPDVKATLDQTAQYNVVLVVVDALRGDYLKPISRAATRYPNLARLMKSGHSFPNAFSSAAGTDVGMTTMLTGALLYSPAGRRTLPMAFHGAKVRTHGIYQREVDRWLGPAIARRGLSGRKVLINDPDQEEVGNQATAGKVANWGIQFLRQHHDERFFLWLHFFDVHEHHQIDPETLRFKGVPPKERPDTQQGKYDQMVRHVDYHAERFFKELERLDLKKKTIVLFTSDHGEGLAQSARLPAHHGDLLYQPLVDIPLLVKVPGIEGGESQIPASVADIYPTLLDLAGISHGGVEGVSLAPFVLGKATARLKQLHRPIFMMENRQHAVLLWPLKLIAWRDRGRVELYDLSKDPRELKDLAASRPQEARRLAAILSARNLSEVDRAKVYKARKWREGAPDEPGAFEAPAPGQDPEPSAPAPIQEKEPDNEPHSPLGEQPQGREQEKEGGQGSETGQQGRGDQGKAGEAKGEQGRSNGQGPKQTKATDEPGAPAIKPPAGDTGQE